MSLGSVPAEARPFQGRPAGLVTRTAAGVVDVIVVLALLMIGYLAINGALFVADPRHFHFVSVSSVVSRTVGLCLLIGYLAVAWWLNGRTYGCRVMGLRVIAAKGGRVRPLVALVRAVICVVFPIGLLLCLFGRRRRSLPDLLLRTAVVYDWRAQLPVVTLPAPLP
ncbi:RDD family protein [Kribbella sp. NPDC051936]|uniref:RDD family protein n=1 Tax=Kribbella sp. NPDC051936 TaxID=3154946 RepID=UPI00344AC203